MMRVLCLVLLAGCTAGEEEASLNAGCDATVTYFGVHWQTGEEIDSMVFRFTYNEDGNVVFYEYDLSLQYEGPDWTEETTWLDADRRSERWVYRHGSEEWEYHFVFLYDELERLDTQESYYEADDNLVDVCAYTYSSQHQLLHADWFGEFESWTWGEDGYKDTYTRFRPDGIFTYWTYEHDMAGHLLHGARYSLQGELRQEVTYTWNGDELVDEEEWSRNSDGEFVLERHSTYTYDAAGQLTVERVEDDEGVLLFTYTYDEVGRPLRVEETTEDGQLLSGWRYEREGCLQ